MRWTTVNPPVVPLLSFEQVQSHLRLDSYEEEAYVMELVAAATAYAEARLGMSLAPRTLSVTFESGDGLYLPYGPCHEVVSVTGADNAPVTYNLKYVGNVPELVVSGAVAWPVTVVYVAGNAVAADIVQMIRVHVGMMYALRSAVDKIDTRTIDEFYRYRGNLPPVR